MDSEPSPMLARFRRCSPRGISEQDLILVPSAMVGDLEEERDLSGWARIDLPARAGLVPVALTLFLSPLVAAFALMGEPDGDEAGEADVTASIPPIAGTLIRPQRWPRGFPCPGGLDDDDD